MARTVERSCPDAPGLAYLCGLLALNEGFGKKAAHHLARALAQAPDVPPLLLAMARAQGLQKRDRAAETAYLRLLRLVPDLADACAELGRLQMRLDRPGSGREWLRRASWLRPDQPRILNDLGLAERALSHFEAAALAFAAAIDCDPIGGSAQAHANLAGILRRLKRPGEAVSLARRAIEIEPRDASHWLELGQVERDSGGLGRGAGGLRAGSEARCGLPGSLVAEGRLSGVDGAAGGGGGGLPAVVAPRSLRPLGASLALAAMRADAPPAGAPAAFVRDLFDQYADAFDQDLVETLGYRGPATMAEAIVRALGSGPFDCFDAGCGTGLAGLAIRPLVARLDGCDLSPRMIAKARARGIYDTLEVGDLVSVLSARPRAYDLVLAADVLIYLGELGPAFAAAVQALRLGGGFAFTVESHAGEPPAGDGPRLQASRRFAHSRAYLRRLADDAGFSVLSLEDRPVRRDRGAPVPGLVAVLRKV